MYFAIRRNAGGKYWFRVVSANHRTLAHSEMYEAKAGAQNAIEAIQAEAADGTVVDMTGPNDSTAERPY